MKIDRGREGGESAVALVGLLCLSISNGGATFLGPFIMLPPRAATAFYVEGPIQGTRRFNNRFLVVKWFWPNRVPCGRNNPYSFSSRWSAAGCCRRSLQDVHNEGEKADDLKARRPAAGADSLVAPNL